jgi:hypothetical protein
LSLLSATNAGHTGLNWITQAVSSTSTWYAFAEHVRPHRHQRFELEGDEALFEQNIAVGVNEAPERTRERIGAQPVTHDIVLHLSDEVADSALLGRGFRDQFQRPPQCLALIRNWPHALKLKPVFEQSLQLHTVGLVVYACERTERNLVLSEIEMLPVESLGQNVGRVALVEEKDLPVRDCTEVRRDHAQRYALAAPGWTIDSRVTGVANMEV